MDPSTHSKPGALHEWSGRMVARARRLFPGLLIAGTVAMAARFLSLHYEAPVMLLALLWNYVAVYRDIPNRFTLSLLLFTVALLLYAVSSNPLLPIVLGFSHGTTLGPFVFLPDVFASIAVVVLLYQSYS